MDRRGVNRQIVAAAILLLISVPAHQTAVAQRADSVPGSLVHNGRFETWERDVPAHWETAQGAGVPNGQPSQLKRLEQGLQLSGNAQTQSWKTLQQSFQAAPGTSLLVEAEAKAEGLKIENGQFDNCFVGLFFVDQNGQRTGMDFVSVSSAKWQTLRLNSVVPPATTQCQLTIFLSNTAHSRYAQSLLPTNPTASRLMCFWRR